MVSWLRLDGQTCLVEAATAVALVTVVEWAAARRRGARAKRTGAYLLEMMTSFLEYGQDDLVAIPEERRRLIALSAPHRKS